METLHLIRSRKFALVTEIKIAGATKLVAESVLRAVIEGVTTKLKTLHVEGQDSTDAALLSRAALRVENFSVTGAKASQVQDIFTAVSETTDLALKNLDLGGFGCLAEVSPDILGLASVKLETLRGGRVSSAQIEEILTRLSITGESKLRKLDLDLEEILDLDHMDPEILTEALVKLKTADSILQQVGVSSEQMTHLLTKISNTEDLRLTGVNLSFVDISQLPSAVLTGAVSRLEKVDINGYGSDLAPGQLEAIFTMLATQQPGGSRLKELSLVGPNRFDRFDLSGISPELLLVAIRNLEKIYLDGIYLTAELLEAILSMVNEASHGKLNKITIVYPQVQGTVCPELLQAAKQVKDLLEISGI